MEYFIEMSKGFRRETAGLLFEHFLAKVFGGAVVGQKNNAVDFVVGSGKNKVLGSSKLISKSAGRTILPQAVGEFYNNIDEKIIYLIGVKSASPTRISKQAVDPLEIEKVDIYKFEVVFSGKKGGKDKQGRQKYQIGVKTNDNEEMKFTDKLWAPPKSSKVRGGKDSEGGDRGSKGYFNFGKLLTNMQPIGTLQIMTTTEEGIKGFRQLVREKATGDTKKILDLVEQLFKNLRLADEKSRIYTSSGAISDGTEALKALTDSQTNLRQIGDYAFTDKKDEYDKLPEPNDT